MSGVIVWAAAAHGAGAAESSAASSSESPAAPVVKVYVFLKDVFAVRGSDQTFDADVTLIAEWDDPRLAGRWPAAQAIAPEDAWHPGLMLLNRRGAAPLLPPRLLVQPSGHVQYQQRWSGSFSVPMDLHDFPRDSQHFDIQFVSVRPGAAEVVSLIPYSAPDRPYRARHFSITDWSMGPAALEQDSVEFAPGMKKLPGVSLSWQGHRHFSYYLAQELLPLVLIVFMGWTALLQDRSTAPSRITVASTAMLTLIAYRFSLGSELPNLAYLTRFDYFMLGSTILVFLVLLLVTVSARLVSAGQGELVNRLDRTVRFAFPAVFIVMLLLILYA